MSATRKVVVSEDELGRRRVAHARKLKALFSKPSSVASQTLAAYISIFDELLVDVAQEAHREAHTLGTFLPSNDCPAARLADAFDDRQAPTKHAVDLFGQSHPAVAADIVVCRNCGRQMAAGRFAPHLEKCLGKGRTSTRATRRVAPQ